MRQLIVHWDGSCGPKNPGGTAAYGYVIKDTDDNVIHREAGRVGKGPKMSNNVAEYSGLYQAMLYVAEHYPRLYVEFIGDSSLVVSQMCGESKAKQGLYIPYYEKTIELARPYIDKGLWTFKWVSRAFNSEADELAQYHRF